MGIADSITTTYNDVLKQYGSNVLIFSGAKPTLDSDYGHVTGTTWGGSYFSQGFLVPLTANERQFLPEGYRTDEVLSFLGKTNVYFAIGDQIQVSGTSDTYEIMQLTDLKMIEDSVVYKKMTVKKI